MVERDEPAFGPDDLFVQVQAFGINRADIMQRKGRYPAPPGVPADVPGLERFLAPALVLIDPALATTETDRVEIRAGQLRNHDLLTVEEQASNNPHWHPQDIQSSVNAHRSASRFAVEHACIDNPDWDVIEIARRLPTPTFIVQGDPTVLARYTDEHIALIETVNPRISHTMISGTGHSPHRDNPTEFLARIDAFLG